MWGCVYLPKTYAVHLTFMPTLPWYKLSPTVWHYLPHRCVLWCSCIFPACLLHFYLCRTFFSLYQQLLNNCLLLNTTICERHVGNTCSKVLYVFTCSRLPSFFIKFSFFAGLYTSCSQNKYPLMHCIKYVNYLPVSIEYSFNVYIK